MTEHTLAWGVVVKTRHGDALQSWPRDIRRAASSAIERSKQHMREKHGGLEFISQHSSCTEQPGGRFQLYIEVLIRTP